jgi:mycothiol system anti-sigma-R factor
LSPTDCEHVLKRIELYLDGELVASMRVEIEHHLGGCDPCSGHAAFQRRLKEVLRSKCGCDQVPPELVDRLRALLERPHAHPS